MKPYIYRPKNLLDISRPRVLSASALGPRLGRNTFKAEITTNGSQTAWPVVTLKTKHKHDQLNTSPETRNKKPQTPSTKPQTPNSEPQISNDKPQPLNPSRYADITLAYFSTLKYVSGQW